MGPRLQRRGWLLAAARPAQDVSAGAELGSARALGRAVHKERTPRPGRSTPRAISGPVNWDGVSLMNYHDDYFLSRSRNGVNIQVHKYREYPELVQECDTFPAAMQWVRELMGKSELPANTEIG